MRLVRFVFKKQKEEPEGLVPVLIESHRVALFLYNKVGRRKVEEGRGKKEEGRWKREEGKLCLKA